MTRKIQPKSVVLEGGSGFFWKLWGIITKNQSQITTFAQVLNFKHYFKRRHDRH